MRILIAEDDDASRMVLEAAVRQLGHDCVPARDGAEAWRLFQDAKVDVVISDRSMPAMDGFYQVLKNPTRGPIAAFRST
jgi:two-component system, cell cycle response regulator